MNAYVFELERDEDGARGGARRAQESPDGWSLAQDEEGEQNHEEQLAIRCAQCVVSHHTHDTRTHRRARDEARACDLYRASLNQEMKVDCGRQMEAPVGEA
jgi:hypothetical protein